MQAVGGTLREAAARWAAGTVCAVDHDAHVGAALRAQLLHLAEEALHELQRRQRVAADGELEVARLWRQLICSGAERMVEGGGLRGPGC